MQSLTPCPSRACRPALSPGLRTVGGQNGKKPVEYSHWLPFTTIPGEDRESEQAQLALSPNSGPRLVLRPLGFALPEPLGRPADPNSPGRIANPSYNRSVMGRFPSAGRLNTAAIPAVARVSPRSWARLKQIDRSSLDRSQDLELTPPGYVLSPHPQLLQADRTTRPYPRTAQQEKQAPSRRIATINPNFSPPQARTARKPNIVNRTQPSSACLQAALVLALDGPGRIHRGLESPTNRG